MQCFMTIVWMVGFFYERNACKNVMWGCVSLYVIVAIYAWDSDIEFHYRILSINEDDICKFQDHFSALLYLEDGSNRGK